MRNDDSDPSSSENSSPLKRHRSDDIKMSREARLASDPPLSSYLEADEQCISFTPTLFCKHC